MNKNILITGGAGFIGSNLAYHFQKVYPQCSITIFDIFNDGSKLFNGNHKYLGNYENLKKFEGEIICGDISNKSNLKDLFKRKFDIIFHLAAISDTRAQDQNLILKNNLNPFNFIVDQACKMGAKLVYASSAAVYGNLNNKTFKIGSENPDNPYAYSKYAMDCKTISLIKSPKKYKIVGLRYFNVYGDGEEFKYKTASTILQFANQILNGKNPKLFLGSDKIFRDFVYIDDVIQATVNAGILENSGVYNVGTGTARSFFDVVKIVKENLGSDLKIDYIKNPYEKGYQYFTQADIRKTKEDLNYFPKYNLEKGIKDYMLTIKNKNV